MNTSTREKTGAELYAEREKRIIDAIELRVPDRVPVVLNSLFWHAKYAGLSCREAMYDYDALTEATRRALVEFAPDAYVLPHPVLALGPTMEIMGYRQLKWPGHDGLDPDVPFQYLDREYMRAEEYDDYLFDPTGFVLRKYLPRIASAFEAFARLPNYPALYYTRIIHYTRAFSLPEMAQAFQTLARAGEQMNIMLGKAKAFADEMAVQGFPLIESATALAPFDFFADYFRGSKGIMLDMYRNRERLLAAMEKAARLIPEPAIATAKRSQCNIVFIPLHWPSDGFMSPEQFQTFYWPPLRKVIMALIENGLVPCLLWEGDCTSRLNTIKDIPPGRCIYFFERTDIFKAKEILGDVVCLRGNVPSAMMVTGAPEDVRQYCRKLIELAGRDGGFIMDGAIGIPDESKPENVRAMFDVTREYGVYR